MKKVLLLGGHGYIGSYFLLKTKDIFDIASIDIDWFSLEKNNSTDFNTLSKEYIQKFDTVILLAGHSSVKMCEGNILSSFNNNVRNFCNLISKLSKTQKFLYASSSSVYGQTNMQVVDEEYNNFTPNNYYDLTKQVIDFYASISDINYYGLRFGTVGGWSPNLRTDIMINAMVHSAKIDNHIKLYVKDIMRPILGINDLCNALKTIIESNQDNRGIYNLASLNSTSKDIAYCVSNVLNVPVKEYNNLEIEQITNCKLQSKAYNFAIDTNKFQEKFNFSFNDTIESITKSIVNDYDACQKTNRSYYIKYE
jgi:nucleoside-diphosphate-sugar epimerase